MPDNFDTVFATEALFKTAMGAKGGTFKWSTPDQMIAGLKERYALTDFQASQLKAIYTDVHSDPNATTADYNAVATTLYRALRDDLRSNGEPAIGRMPADGPFQDFRGMPIIAGPGGKPQVVIDAGKPTERTALLDDKGQIGAIKEIGAEGVISTTFITPGTNLIERQTFERGGRITSLDFVPPNSDAQKWSKRTTELPSGAFTQDVRNPDGLTTSSTYPVNVNPLLPENADKWTKRTVVDPKKGNTEEVRAADGSITSTHVHDGVTTKKEFKPGQKEPSKTIVTNKDGTRSETVVEGGVSTVRHFDKDAKEPRETTVSREGQPTVATRADGSRTETAVKDGVITTRVFDKGATEPRETTVTQANGNSAVTTVADGATTVRHFDKGATTPRETIVSTAKPGEPAVTSTYPAGVDPAKEPNAWTSRKVVDPTKGTTTTTRDGEGTLVSHQNADGSIRTDRRFAPNVNPDDPKAKPIETTTTARAGDNFVVTKTGPDGKPIGKPQQIVDAAGKPITTGPIATDPRVAAATRAIAGRVDGVSAADAQRFAQGIRAATDPAATTRIDPKVLPKMQAQALGLANHSLTEAQKKAFQQHLVDQGLLAATRPNPAGGEPISNVDGRFGDATRAAAERMKQGVMISQASDPAIIAAHRGRQPDGLAGPRTVPHLPAKPAAAPKT